MDKKLMEAAEEARKGLDSVPGPMGDLMRSLIDVVTAVDAEDAAQKAADVVGHAERAGAGKE